MKIKIIQLMIYGAIFFGAFIAFCPAIFLALSDYATAFIYAGSVVIVSGIVFSIICLRYPSCSCCHKYLNFREQSTKHCPLCNEKDNKNTNGGEVNGLCSGFGRQGSY